MTQVCGDLTRVSSICAFTGLTPPPIPLLADRVGRGVTRHCLSQFRSCRVHFYRDPAIGDKRDRIGNPYCRRERLPRIAPWSYGRWISGLVSHCCRLIRFLPCRWSCRPGASLPPGLRSESLSGFVAACRSTLLGRRRWRGGGSLTNSRSLLETG